MPARCRVFVISNNSSPISSLHVTGAASIWHFLLYQNQRQLWRNQQPSIERNQVDNNLISRQVLRVLIFQMKTPHKSSRFRPSVQDFIINLSQLPFSFKIIPEDRRRISVVQREGGEGWRKLWTCDLSRKCRMICWLKGTFSPSRQGKLAKSGQQSTRGNWRRNTRKRLQWQRYLIWRKVCSRKKTLQLNSFQDQRRVLMESLLLMVYQNLPLVALQNISQVKPCHQNEIFITFQNIPFH